MLGVDAPEAARRHDPVSLLPFAIRPALALPLVLFLLFDAVPSAAEGGRRSTYRAKAADTPDFLQTDPEAGFANAGTQYCAPSAVSNSLMWLAAHGYDDLRPEGRNDKAAQIAMIRELAAREYMNTSPKIGTDVAQLIHGVAGYVEDVGYTIASLTVDGWRPAPEENASSEYPDLDAIREAIADEQSAVWLNVGWYTYDEDEGTYTRTGGHWVTVVGFAGDDLLIHDPSPSTGAKRWTQRVTLTEITEGELVGNQKNLPRSAEGYYEVGGEMKVGKGRTCVLDAAVILVLE